MTCIFFFKNPYEDKQTNFLLKYALWYWKIYADDYSIKYADENFKKEMENVLNYDFYMFENGLVIGYLNLIPIKLTLYF